MENTALIDLSLFGATFPACFAFCYFMYRQPGYQLPKAVGFFLAFLAMYPLLNMVAHLIAVSYVAVLRAKADVFTYDMKFYALIQFGALSVMLNLYLLQQIKKISSGRWNRYKATVLACLLQIGIVLPLFPFNPLSLLPPMTSVLLIGLLTVARDRARRESNLKLQQGTHVAVPA